MGTLKLLKINSVDFYLFRRVNFQSFTKNRLVGMARKSFVYYCNPIYYIYLKLVFQKAGSVFKVIHTPKKLFCNVALICNLVQEFNGLVSKGPAI